MEQSQPEIVSLCGPRAKKRCREYALVLRAMGIRCEVAPGEGGSHLLVHAQDAERAREQLRLYLQENQAPPPRSHSRFGLLDGLICACLYGVTILVLDVLQRDQAFSLDWWRAGMSQAGLIRAGEWWRTMTALGLHADSVHLIGNLAFGLVFCFLAGEYLGWGLAWSGMLLAGTLGNALDALVRPPDHVSIGASTAVFAILGILSAYTWKQRRGRFDRWAPLGGGAALLAFLGVGGERTDVFAHFAGFGSGCLFGLLFAVLESRMPFAPRYNHVFGIAATLLFALAWAAALRAHG